MMPSPTAAAAMVWATGTLALAPPSPAFFQSNRHRGNSGAPGIPTGGSSSSLTTLHLLKGLQPTVEDEIDREMGEAYLSPFALFRRELEDGANVFSAISAVRKRGKDKAGDYENKYKIMSDFRAYSNRDLLDTDHFGVAPTLDDLSGTLPDRGKVIWVTGPFRLFV